MDRVSSLFGSFSILPSTGETKGNQESNGLFLYLFFEIMVFLSFNSHFKGGFSCI